MRKKVLVCAYSCVSESGVKVVGGEAGLGWNAVCQLGRFFDVYVLTHSQNKSSIENLTAQKGQQNIKFFYIKLPWFLSFLEKWHKGGIQIYAYLWQIKAYFVAKTLHKKYKFYVFHHITYANDWMASYIGALLPVPYVRGPGGGAHRIPKNFLQEFSFKDKLSDKLRSVGQWIFRHDPFFIIGQNKAKAILVCNQEAFDALSKKWQKKSYFFPVNGISREDFDLLSVKNKDSKNFSVVTAGKLIKIKGFDLAIKAFVEFAENKSDVKLEIIGNGPEAENLKGFARNLKVEDKIIFEPWMAREKLLQKMASSDVFLFASLRDGGGNVVVEAMAAGTPVVCLDIGGPGFHIDKKCGIKIKPESPNQTIQEMSDALLLLYKSVSLRQSLGQAAQQKVKNFYSWDKLGEQLLKIYEKFISE